MRVDDFATRIQKQWIPMSSSIHDGYRQFVETTTKAALPRASQHVSTRQESFVEQPTDADSDKTQSLSVWEQQEQLHSLNQPTRLCIFMLAETAHL